MATNLANMNTKDDFMQDITQEKERGQKSRQPPNAKQN